MSDRIAISYSRISLTQMCGEAARRRYMEKQTNFTGWLAVRGKAAHKGREVNFEQKKTSFVDLIESDVTDAARQCAVDDFNENEVIPDNDHEGMGKAAMMSEAIDSATRFVKADYKAYQVPTQPREVELNITVELPAFPFDLRTIIDLVDIGWGLRDFKTKKRTPSQGDADTSEQLTIQDLAFQANFKRPPSEISLDCLVDLKGGVKDVRLITTRTPEDYQAVLNRIAVVNQAFEAGIFVPCDSGHWKCSKSYCEYFPTCRYVVGGKRKD